MPSPHTLAMVAHGSDQIWYFDWVHGVSNHWEPGGFWYCGMRKKQQSRGFQKEFDCRLLMFGFSRVMENHDGQFPDLTLRAPHNNYSMKDCKLLIIRVCHQKHGVLKMCVKDTALSGLQWLGSLKPQFSFKSWLSISKAVCPTVCNVLWFVSLLCWAHKHQCIKLYK